MGNETAREEDLERAAAEVSSHDARKALGALCFDVLSRQAEGRVLFSGREFVEARAREHGVERALAGTQLGNLVDILERGAGTAAERALVAAFAVDGLGWALGRSTERADLLFRFVHHADWLETASPYVVYPLVERVLDPEVARTIWSTLADLTLAEGCEPEVSPTVRGRQAARLAVLAAASPAVAHAELLRVATDSPDRAARALAEALAKGPAPSSAGGLAAGPVRVSGRLARARSAAWIEVLRWLSGVAVAAWLVRGLLSLTGFRREAELELIDGGVKVRTTSRLFGRVVRESSDTYVFAAIAGAGRETRFSALGLVVGAVALASGVLVGGLLGFDGIRAGEPSLLALAAVVVLAGAGLDLALDVLLAARKGRVACALRVLPRRELRIEGVVAADADHFLASLEQALVR